MRKRTVGYILIASPFISLFVFIAWTVGVVPILKTLGLTAVLVIPIAAGTFLVDSDD